MNNLSNTPEIVAQRALKGKDRGKPSLPELSVSLLINVKRAEWVLRKRYRIADRCYSLIMEFVSVWMTSRRGITLSEMCIGVYGFIDGSAMTVVHDLKDQLVRKGLVEYVGNNKRGFKLFAPTVTLLDDIKELLVSVS